LDEQFWFGANEVETRKKLEKIVGLMATNET